MTTQQHNLDSHAILKREREMRVRNAILELLRAWEDLNDLPRAVPNKFERLGEKPERGHHNR